MEQRRLPDSFDPLTMLMSVNSDNAGWKEQVTTGIIYLLSVVDELREENLDLKRQMGVTQPRSSQSEGDEKLVFNAMYVKSRPIKGFDPLQPNRVKAIGSIVADFANGHGLNGCSLTQVIQPITTGVIRKLFGLDAQKYTYTEDSVGKGRPVTYAKVPTEFIKELSEAICDGFNPTRTQRAQILPQARTMSGTVARNYFNNARSHQKKGKSDDSASSPAQPNSNETNIAEELSPEPQPTQFTISPQLFDGRGFQPVYLPFPQPTTLPLNFAVKLNLEPIGSQMENLQNMQNLYNSSNNTTNEGDSKMESE